MSGNTAEQPVLPVPGEVFALRKLMPPQPQYDFNIHVMDFQPGESLHVKVGGPRRSGCGLSSAVLEVLGGFCHRFVRDAGTRPCTFC